MTASSGDWRSEQQELSSWLFQQAGARGGPGLHGPPARRRGRLREPYGTWILMANGQRINNRTERGGRGEVVGKSMLDGLVRKGGRRMHRSWEEGAGREQVRRGGGAGREGGASSEGQQGSSRDQGQERKREKLGLGAGQGQGGTRRGGDLGRSREGSSNAPSLLLPTSSPFLLFSSLLLPPRLPLPSPAPSPLLLPSSLLLAHSLLSSRPSPLLCSSPASMLAHPSFSFALRSSIVATLSTLHHRYLRQPYGGGTLLAGGK